MSGHGAARDITFIYPVGKKSPRKNFGPPIDGVYPQINSQADPEQWRRTIYPAIASLRDAFVIFTAESQKASAFIHGQFLSDLPEVTYRRRLPKWEKTKTRSIEDAPRVFMLIDLDNAPHYEGDVTKMTPQQVWSWVRLCLPEEMRRADCILQLSQSFGTKPGVVKVHVVVELSRPLNWPQRDNLLALSSGADKRVNQPEQMVFICDPCFEGCDDPLAGTPLASRWFYIEGETPVVEVPTDEQLDERAAEAKRAKDEARRAKRGEQAGPFSGARKSGGGSYHSGLDYWIKQIGAVGDDGQRHFEGPRLAAVRAFVAAEGAHGDLAPFLDALRQHLTEIGADRLQHPGYIEAVIADMPRLVADWAAKLRDRDLPQPCEWTGPQTVTLDEATAALDQFVEDTTKKTVELFDKRVTRLAARRAIEKVKESGRHAYATKVGRAFCASGVFPAWAENYIAKDENNFKFFYSND